mmetsp:Transcript_18378/g.56130  ORF Transcript_18378/g.56130 Transcript_18378/m.56130 type:complete len:112 (-) Transcript_18378:62-397(-)
MAPQPLPDFDDMPKQSRSAQRRAKKERLQAEAAEREANPLNQIPDRLTILDFLTKIAWGGVGVLVAWEVFINSPFFDREALYTAFPAPGEASSVPITQVERKGQSMAPTEE